MVAFGVNRGRYRDGSAIYLSLLFFLLLFFLDIDVFKSTVERTANFRYTIFLADCREHKI